MDKMKSHPLKGLFFRELYLSRKSYISFALIILLYSVISSLVLLSLKIGNLSLLEDAEEMREEMYLMLTYVTSAFCGFFSMTVIDVIHVDMNTKWLGFIYASPIKEEKYMAIKFALMLIFNLVNIAFSVIIGLIFFGIEGASFTYENFAVIMCITAVMDIGISYFAVLSVAFKDMNTASTVFVATFMIFFISFIIFFITNFSSKLSAEKVEAFIMSVCLKTAPFTPFIIIAAFLIGYFISVKFVKRRHK